MKITPQCVVALTWTLKDTLGDVLDELDEPIEFLLGGDDLLAKVEEALQGHEAGDKLELHLEPETPLATMTKAWCSWSPARSSRRARRRHDLRRRRLFRKASADGAASAYLYGHRNLSRPRGAGWQPSAGGIAIRLALKVESVREATEEEIGQGTLGTGFFKLEPLTPGSGTLH